MATPDAHILTMRLRAPAMPEGYLERGDRLDRELLGLNDETERTTIYIRAAVPLTREAYLTEISSRPPGTIGHGFTLEELVEREILTQQEADATLKLAQTGEAYRGHFIVTVMQGKFRRLEVRDETGKVVRPQRFISRQKALEWIDGLHVQPEPVDAA